MKINIEKIINFSAFITSFYLFYISPNLSFTSFIFLAASIVLGVYLFNLENTFYKFAFDKFKKIRTKSEILKSYSYSNTELLNPNGPLNLDFVTEHVQQKSINKFNIFEERLLTPFESPLSILEDLPQNCEEKKLVITDLHRNRKSRKTLSQCLPYKKLAHEMICENVDINTDMIPYLGQLLPSNKTLFKKFFESIKNQYDSIYFILPENQMSDWNSMVNSLNSVQSLNLDDKSNQEYLGL